jgi:hypothetical protein
LIVGGDGDVACVQRLIATAEREYAASPRAISPALYTVDEKGTVVPLVLPTGHPLANDVALGHLRMALVEYENQQKVLQETLGEDIYVAGLTGVRLQDGTPTSFATWAAGVLSLLPKADAIAFVIPQPDESKPEIFRVRWSDVERLAGDLLELEPSYDPPRWRTKGWPDDAVLTELRALSI